MKIANGKNIPLNVQPGTLPDVSGALLNWLIPMTFTKVVRTTSGFQAVETPTVIQFNGVWQPFGPEQLKLLEQGERAWKWFMCHTLTALELAPGEYITYRNVQYRVVPAKLDYALYGYYEYHLVEDWEGSGP